MKYLLDTNICIHFFRNKYGVYSKLEEVGIGICAISEVTLAELKYGAEVSGNPIKNHKIIDDFTSLISVLPFYGSIPLYAKEKARLKRLGTLISDFDLLIGCTAIENELIMVTENTKEFKRLSNIKIENWVNRNGQ